jgi:hypothetical protein
MNRYMFVVLQTLLAQVHRAFNQVEVINNDELAMHGVLGNDVELDGDSNLMDFPCVLLYILHSHLLLVSNDLKLVLQTTRNFLGKIIG